jgi:hypothetical protein
MLAVLVLDPGKDSGGGRQMRTSVLKRPEQHE